MFKYFSIKKRNIFNRIELEFKKVYVICEIIKSNNYFVNEE